jgi:hypothetical protein
VKVDAEPRPATAAAVTSSVHAALLIALIVPAWAASAVAVAGQESSPLELVSLEQTRRGES